MNGIRVNEWFWLPLRTATILNGTLTLLLSIISIIARRPIPIEIFGFNPHADSIVHFTGEPYFNSAREKYI